MIRRSMVWVLLAGLLAGVAPVIPIDAQAKEIRWGTSRVGSSGNRAVTNLVQVLNEAVPGYNFTVQPTPGAIVTVKGYAIGDFEGYYGSDVAFYELANNVNRFEGFQEKMKREPVQSFWTFTIEMGVGIHARDMGTIARWGDLDGVRVFTGPRSWDTRAQLERAFKVLGINHEYIEVGVKEAGSLLEQGRFGALGVYSSAESATSPWITQASLQTDWASLNPAADEIETLGGAGIKVVEVDTSVFGKKKTHVAKAVMLPFFYGLHLGMDVPEEDMYRILLATEENVDELAAADKAFKQIQKDMPLMQRRGVEAAADLVRIHPGLAKYMRERGVWEAKWDSRVAQ